MPPEEPGIADESEAIAKPGKSRKEQEQKMSNEERELMRHDLENPPSIGEPTPPPFVDAPDEAEAMRLLEKISRMPDIRFEKVQEMRALIANGQLETPERVDGTVRRLIEELGL